MLPLNALAALVLLTVDPTAYHAVRFGELESEVVAQHPEAFGERRGADVSFQHPIEKLRVRVVWTGRVRTMTGFKQDFVARWCKYNFPQVADQVRREIEVLEGGRVRWLPIQEILVPALAAEVRPGGELDVYVVWFGAANAEFAYLVNEFQAAGG